MDQPAAATDQPDLLSRWETAGLAYLAPEQVKPIVPQLPPDLPLAAGVSLFLGTLKGQSRETAKTYRVGCRRFMWFIYTTTGHAPDRLAVSALSPLVLEDFYLWLVGTYGRKARSTCNSYMAAARNLFDYLARRRITPGGCQYQEMVAGLSRLQGRASYKTPRVKGQQVSQVARLALKKLEPEQEGVEIDGSGQPPEANSEAAPAPPGELLKSEPDENAVKARQPRSQTEKDRRALEEMRDRAIILTLYSTGMRRQELASLDRADLESLLVEYRQNQRMTGQAAISREKAGSKLTSQEADQGGSEVYELIITGKGQKERLVYFDRLALTAVEEYLNRRGKDGFRPLFLQHHRGRDKVKAAPGGENYRASLVTVWQVVARYAARLGLDLKPHDFRHNLATTLLNAGAQLSEVQDILGHASPTTTKQIYAHYDKSHLREAFSKYRKSAAGFEVEQSPQ
jgi:site-specific recombinase XerD